MNWITRERPKIDRLVDEQGNVVHQLLPFTESALELHMDAETVQQQAFSGAFWRLLFWGAWTYIFSTLA